MPAPRQVRPLIVVVASVLIAAAAGPLDLPVPRTGSAWAHPTAGHDQRTGANECVCVQAKRTNGWCGACDRGYAAGIPIPSASLYEMLDPHGHEFDPDGVSCPVCRKVMQSEGYCEGCEIGYAGGRAYVSRLAHLLAKAAPAAGAVLDCDRCRGHLDRQGWCGRCGRGIAGGAVFDDRGSFDDACGELLRLKAALELLQACELCAVASFSDGRCPTCNVFYRDGRPTPPATPPRQ